MRNAYARLSHDRVQLPSSDPYPTLRAHPLPGVEYHDPTYTLAYMYNKRYGATYSIQIYTHFGPPTVMATVPTIPCAVYLIHNKLQFPQAGYITADESR